MLRSIVFSFLVIALLSEVALGQSTAKYQCALTQDEYLRSPEVLKKMQQDDEERIAKLKLVDNKYAKKYRSLKTQEEKQSYINFLINHEFNVSDIHDPKEKAKVDFLKLFDFSIVSAQDHQRCTPVMEGLIAYNDSLNLYFRPIQKSGCEFFIYGITNQEEIGKLACVLRDLINKHNSGPITASFFYREVFEGHHVVSDSSQAVIKGRNRDEEALIDKLVIK